MISAFNYTTYGKGSIIGFFDIQIGIVTIKGARLMAGKDNDQMWVALPQMPSIDDEGSKKYHEIIHVTAPAREHIRSQVIGQLTADGHIGVSEPKPAPKAKPRPGQFRGQENQDQYYSSGSQDDVPF